MNPRARNRVVTGALILLIVLVVVGAALGMPSPVRADEAFRAQVSAPISLATDHHRSRYWTLEKASGRLTLVALTSAGAVEGSMNSRDSLTNARGLAFVDGQAYVGDLGGQRSEISVYQVTEPWPGTEILKAIRYRLTYPDGAHEGAALLVGPDHRLRVVTAGTAAGIYEAPANPPAGETASALVRVADAPAGVSDGVALRDGRVVLRTADRLVTLDPTSWSRVDERVVDTPEQGGAVTEALAANQVLTALGPEGLFSTWTVPGPVPTTTPTPRATVASDVTTQASGTEERTMTQTGTLVALGAAGALALLCGLFVLVKRR